jgi:Putative beta-barrel porin-2, OmpL-like. bbp2
MNRKIVLIISGLLINIFSSIEGHAQKLDTVSTFSITAYLDAYYAYYTDSVGTGNFQKFPSVSPRSNNPSLNTVQLAVQYNAEKVRGMAVLHFGDIAASTWSPAPYNHLMEAHVGFKVFSKLWIDAGFFRTHFGTEFLLPSENITSSVSVGTFYEPYYESGIRLNFDPTKKLEINVFLLNGYGVFVENNNKKSVGMGITYALNDYAGIGYTNYIGDESVIGDPVNHLRMHQNVFFNYQRNKIKLQVGGDYCLQQNSDIATGHETASMYSALATFRYQAARKFAVYTRAEIFQDPDGWMSGVIKDYKGKATGLKLWGLTAGAEFKPTDESYVRLEGRMLKMDQDQYIFNYNGNAQNVRFEVMVNAGVTFDLLKRYATKMTTIVEREPSLEE